MKRTLLLLLLCSLFAFQAAGQQIPIAPDQIRVVKGLPTAVLAFDQNLTTSWFPGWSASEYPARCVVDLGDSYRLEKIRVYDGQGRPRLNFYAGDDSAAPFLTVPLEFYQHWLEYRLKDMVARYVVVEISHIEGNAPVYEIEFYGTPTDGPPTGGGDTVIVVPPDPPAVTPGKWSGSGATIGLCVFPWSVYDIPLIAQSFPTVRVWADMVYFGTPAGVMFEPLASGRGDFDTLFKRLKEGGVTAFPVLENSPPHLNGGGDHRWNDRGDGSEADHYLQFINDFLIPVVGRYGANKNVPAAKLKVNTTPRWNGDPPNQIHSGLNLFRYIEIENEPTRWWKGVDERYTAEQYAALMLASYRAAKEIDPGMRVVMGGLSEPNLTYLKRMKAWYDGRGLAFPCDVVNIHYYANDGNKEIGDTDEKLNLTRVGCAPEVDRYYERMKPIVDFARALGKPVWLTEYGYDTGPQSVQRSPAFGPYDSEEVAGIWMQRTVLESFRAGVEKTFAYNSEDEPSWRHEDPNSDGLYRSTGIFYSGGYGHKPKKVYHFLMELIAHLNGYEYQKDLSAGNIRVLLFKSSAAEKYVYWVAAEREAQAMVTINGAWVTATEEPQFMEVPIKKKRWFRYKPNTSTPTTKAPAGRKGR